MTRRPITRITWMFFAACVALSACIEDDELPGAAVCNETAAALASQALACSSDPDISNAQADLFHAHYTCAALDNDLAFACAGYLQTAPCDVVLAATLEPLLKRTAPICTEVVRNIPNDTQPVVAPGEAHAYGMFNNSTSQFDCTFSTASVTSENLSTFDPNTVVANAACNNGTFGFSLVVQNTAPNVTYTGLSGPGPLLENLVFPNYAGANDATVTSQALSFSQSRIDPFGYFHGTATFQVTAQGPTLSYTLAGDIDLVLTPR